MRSSEPTALDARVNRDGARRAIAWDALRADALDKAKRAIVGATWLERMKQEHLAVGAFSLLAQELAEQGCGSVVLSLVARAAADEVRHAEVCRRVAVALLGEDAVPARFRGLPKVPLHAEATAPLRALLHVVEMCCLSETVTGVYFTEMVARASHPVVRAILESLLEDEIDHGRVGWAYLATRVREGTAGGLGEALPRMLDRTVGRALRDLAQEPASDDPAMEAFGYLGSATGTAVIERALRDVIVPGLELLEVDLAPARAHIAARGWR